VKRSRCIFACRIVVSACGIHDCLGSRSDYSDIHKLIIWSLHFVNVLAISEKVFGVTERFCSEASRPKIIYQPIGCVSLPDAIEEEVPCRLREGRARRVEYLYCGIGHRVIITFADRSKIFGVISKHSPIVNGNWGTLSFRGLVHEQRHLPPGASGGAWGRIYFAFPFICSYEFT